MSQKQTVAILHVVDHAPDSPAWALLRASLAPGDSLLLTESALFADASALDLPAGVTLYHQAEQARALGAVAPGQPMDYQQWVQACLELTLRCWH